MGPVAVFVPPLTRGFRRVPHPERLPRRVGFGFCRWGVLHPLLHKVRFLTLRFFPRLPLHLRRDAACPARRAPGEPPLRGTGFSLCAFVAQNFAPSAKLCGFQPALALPIHIPLPPPPEILEPNECCHCPEKSRVSPIEPKMRTADKERVQNEGEGEQG